MAEISDSKVSKVFIITSSKDFMMSIISINFELDHLILFKIKNEYSWKTKNKSPNKINNQNFLFK